MTRAVAPGALTCRVGEKGRVGLEGQLEDVWNTSEKTFMMVGRAGVVGRGGVVGRDGGKRQKTVLEQQ